MFTQDNTEGFTDEQLEQMNNEVDDYFKLYWPTMQTDDVNYHECLQWAEETVLIKHCGI